MTASMPNPDYPALLASRPGWADRAMQVWDTLTSEEQRAVFHSVALVAVKFRSDGDALPLVNLVRSIEGMAHAERLPGFQERRRTRKRPVPDPNGGASIEDMIAALQGGTETDR